MKMNIFFLKEEYISIFNFSHPMQYNHPLPNTWPVLIQGHLKSVLSLPGPIAFPFFLP